MEELTELTEITQRCVEKAEKLGVDQSEAVTIYREKYLTRFANSQIHQNVGEKALTVSIRLVKNKKVARATSLFKNFKSLDGIVEKLFNSLKYLRSDPDFKSLPKPEKIADLPIYVKETAECTPEKRADIVKSIINSAHDHSNKVKSVSGAVSTEIADVSIFNSLGLAARSKFTSAYVNVNVMSENSGSQGFGQARRVSRNIKDIDGEEIGLEAAKGSVDSLSPSKTNPGKYRVILKPYAVADLLGYLGYMGLHARSVEEGESFMLDLKGERAIDEKLTIWDEGVNMHGMAFPFDIEGVPKKKVVFFDRGVAKEVVYDSYMAFKEGRESTGHASFERFWTGPMPSHVFMNKGDSTIDEMISETGKGLLITRFHYIRPVHPRKTIITGMTRDGIWLVENGEIKHPVRNMRFTDSILGILSHVELIGKTWLTLEGWMEAIPSSLTVPALKAEALTFTSLTEY